MKNIYHLEQLRGKDEETLEEFFTRHINREMFDFWAEPMFEVMCSYTGSDISRKAFLGLMAGYMGTHSLTFEGGIGLLPRALAATLNVQLEACVEQVELSDGRGARIHYVQGDQRQNLDADRVIVAVPGSQVLSLFEHPRPAWQAFFPKVEYSSSAMQFSIAESDFQPPTQGVFLPPSEKLPINSISFEQYQDGRWLVMTDPSVAFYHMGTPDTLLVERAESAISTVFPALKDTFRAHRIFRWPVKVPKFRPGYLGALARFWQDPQEGPVYFCGDYFAGPSTGGALFSGWECATRVLQAL